MKKFTALLMALIICCSMIVGVSAASGDVTAEPVTTQAIPTTQSTADVLGGFISDAIGNNQEEVNDATLSIESISSTISQILNALDDFLRGLRIFVDQLFSNVLGGGSFPM